MIYTTYNLAVEHNACERALVQFLNVSLGLVLKEGQQREIDQAAEKFGKDIPIPLTDILDFLGIDDCLWAFRTVQDEEAADIIVVKFLTAIADRMSIYFESKYSEDKLPRQAVEALRAYFLNPSNKTLYAVDEAYTATNRMDISVADRMSLRVLLAGGIWSYGSYCGSRSRRAYYSRWSAPTDFGGRALSESEQKWQIAKLKELLAEA
jgi:hypothetical protein